MTDERQAGLRAALEAIAQAEKAVDDLCLGRLRWEMRVPAEPDHDPDLIISDALSKARAALAVAHVPAQTGLDDAYAAGLLDGEGSLRESFDLVPKGAVPAQEERLDSWGEEHCCNDPSHMSPEYLAAIEVEHAALATPSAQETSHD